MIKIALETPVDDVKFFSPFQDYLFVLAQEVLKNGFYLDQYRDILTSEMGQPNQRICVLDNGVHERGFPLEPFELLEAANLLFPRPDPEHYIVVAPDWKGEMQRSLEATLAFASSFSRHYFSVGGVVQGKDVSEMLTSFKSLYGEVEWFLFPYKSPRLDFLSSLSRAAYSEQPLFSKAFLLGFNGFAEALAIDRLFDGQIEWHLDTGEPIKAAYHERPLHYSWDAHQSLIYPTHEPLSERLVGGLAVSNVRFFRKALNCKPGEFIDSVGV